MKESNALVIDSAHHRILHELSLDARASDVAIGERINLSSSSVARRRKALEDSGIILGYDVRLDLGMLGLSGVVVVSLELTSQSVEVLDEFEREVIERPSISYCGFVSGENDFVILIHVASFNDYDRAFGIRHRAGRGHFELRDRARGHAVVRAPRQPAAWHDLV